MNEQENVQAVQKLFAAFGQANIPSALDILAEDVDWQSPVRRSPPSESSWAKPRHGRAEVAKFLENSPKKCKSN